MRADWPHSLRHLVGYAERWLQRHTSGTSLKILTKSEIENIFLKFDSEEAIRVMSKIVTGANLRNTKLSIKHIFHILKNKLYLDNSEEWLNIYYDTINTLNLIVDILKNKEINKKNNILI